MRVLLADDDRDLVLRLKQDLETDGHTVDAVVESDRAIELARLNTYQVGLMNDELTCLAGLGACRSMLNSGTSPYILMISSESESPSRIRCLRCGADDYLTKPIAYDELIERMRAVIRRLSRTMTYGDLRLDMLKRTAERNGKNVALTNREFELLSYFMHHPDTVLPREALAAEVWSMPFDTGTNIVDVYVTYLRRKLSRLGAPLIQTIRGKGYCFGAAD